MMDARLPEHVVRYISPEPNSGCWLWDGAVCNKGYGVTTRFRAHRVVYSAIVGEIPKGLVLDHKCRVRSCCNPDHLEPVTSRENVLRGIGVAAQNARKLICDNGHPLDDVYIDPKGHRYCRACRPAMRLKRKDKHKEYLAGWREANREKTRAASKRHYYKKKGLIQ